MKPTIDRVFDDADQHYLKPPALKEINTYVVSLSDRVNAYRVIRDREVSWMQTVANQLESVFAEETVERLEQALKFAMLGLRHGSMAMLMDDIAHLSDHFLPWLKEANELHLLNAINAILYPSLMTQINQSLNDRQMDLLRPFFMPLQDVLAAQAAIADESLLTMAGLF